MWQPSRHFVVVRRIKALMKIMQILKLDKSRTLSGVKGFMCKSFLGKRCLAKEVCGVKFGGKGFLSTSCLASTSCRVFCMHSLTL